MADSDRQWEYKYSFQAHLFSPCWKDAHVGLSAAVERGPSQGARSGSTEPTWVSLQESSISQTSLRRSGQGCPLLRALDEHSFIVRVLRARRAPGRIFSPAFRLSTSLRGRPGCSSNARVERAPSERARSASRRTTRPPPLPPSNGEFPPAPGLRRLCSTMEQTRLYQRNLYRLPVTCPAMYCAMSTVGEGKITNLSAVGCTIETDQPLPADQNVALRLMLPDQRESLPIDEAQVRWVHGNLAGIEFIQVEYTANLRLHGLVWDGMVQRFRALQQKRATS